MSQILFERMIWWSRPWEPLGPRYSGHVVYVVGFAKYVKIGSSMSLESRMMALVHAVRSDLVLFTTIRDFGRVSSRGVTPVEAELHRRFAGCRVCDPSVLRLFRGEGLSEWFYIRDELEAWVRSGCPYPLAGT